jgi:hypothetical protein
MSRNPHTGKVRPTSRAFDGIRTRSSGMAELGRVQQIGIHVAPKGEGSGLVILILETGRETTRSEITTDTARQIIGMLERAIEAAEPAPPSEYDDLLAASIEATR